MLGAYSQQQWHESWRSRSLLEEINKVTLTAHPVDAPIVIQHRIKAAEQVRFQAEATYNY